MRTNQIAKLTVLAVFALLCIAATPTPLVGKKESRFMSRVFGPDQSYDFQASTLLRSFTREHAYTPILIQVHNRTANPIEVSRDQFVLQDKSGTEIKPIDEKEYLENYRVQGERNLIRLSGRLDHGFIKDSHLRYVEPSRFYPSAKETGGVNSTVQVKSEYTLRDIVYFPQVTDGEYNLLYKGSDGETLVLPVTL